MWPKPRLLLTPSVSQKLKNSVCRQVIIYIRIQKLIFCKHVVMFDLGFLTIELLYSDFALQQCSDCRIHSFPNSCRPVHKRESEETFITKAVSNIQMVPLPLHVLLRQIRSTKEQVTAYKNPAVARP